MSRNSLIPKGNALTPLNVAITFLFALSATTSALSATLTLTARPPTFPATGPLTLPQRVPFSYNTSTCKFALPLDPNSYGYASLTLPLVSGGCQTVLQFDGLYYPISGLIEHDVSLITVAFPGRNCQANQALRIQPTPPVRAISGTGLMSLGPFLISLSSTPIQYILASPGIIVVRVTSTAGNVTCTNPIPLPTAVIFKNGFE